MDSNIQLRHHLLTQFLLKPKSDLKINEERHHLSEIDALTKYFYNLVKKQIRLAFENKTSITNIYSEKIPIQTFFKYFKLDFTIEYSDDKSKHGYGGDFKNSSIFKNNNGEWVCHPIMSVKVVTDSWMKSSDIFLFVLAHELTHGYDHYKTAIDTGKVPSESIAIQRYRKISDAINSKIQNVSASAHMLYRLNRMERNAFIGQLRTELKRMDPEGMTFNEFYEAVKITASFEQFKNLENNVVAVLNVTNNQTKKELIDALNDIMDRKFTTFNQVKKYYWNRWLKWKKIYLRNASKIAYDVYYENGKNSGTDYGMMGKNTLITDGD